MGKVCSSMELNVKSVHKKFYIVYGLTAFVSLFLYLLLIGGKYIWADEAFTFALVKHSYGEIWRLTAADVHPPLYYFILKLLTQPWGYSLASVKVASILPYIFIIMFGGVQFKIFFEEKTAILFMVLFFLFPFSFYYSIEVRMYSFAAAFVFANAVYAYRCFYEANKLNWALFVLSGLAAAYTHYFALVSAAIIYGILIFFIIIKRKELIAAWIVSSVITVVLYLPWLKVFIDQFTEVSADYWIGDITFYELFVYINTIFGSNGISGGILGYGTYRMPIYTLLFSLTYLIALIYIIAAREKKDIFICCCLLLVPILTIVTGVGISLLVRPVFMIRYVIPAIPLLVAFMAVALGRMKNKVLFVCIIVIALAGGISNYAVALRDEYDITENALDDGFVSGQEKAGCYIVSMKQDRISEHVSAILSYYEISKPIYSISSVGPFDTYNNLISISEFDGSEYNTVVLLMDVGERPPEKYRAVYSSEYIGELSATGIGVDAYLLSKEY